MMFNKYKLSNFCIENRGLLLNLAYSWCHSRSLAEDLVQDATEKALKNINRIKNSKAIKAWFIQIMLNCWRDQLRKKQEHKNIDDLIYSADINTNQNLHESTTPADSIESLQLQTAVQKAMSSLPLKYRTVLTLIDIYGASYNEVAEIIDVPKGTVMSRLSRARQAMLKLLSDTQDIENVVSIHNNPVTNNSV